MSEGSGHQATDASHVLDDADIDPVTFEVVRSALYAICEEMRSVMTRAAFSPLLSLSADLSCALLDAAGDVVAQGNDIPVHLGAMPFSARGLSLIHI